MTRLKRIALLSAPMAWAAMCFMAAQLQADGSGSASPTVTVSGEHSPNGKVIEATTQPTTMSASVSCNAPTPTDAEASIVDTKYSCSASVNYRATTQASWGSVPPHVSVTVTPTTQPTTDSTFTVSAVIPAPGYYQIAISGGAQFKDSDGNTYNYSTSAPVNVYFEVVSLDVLWSGSDTLSSTDGSSVGGGASVKNKTCYMAPGVRCQFSSSVQPSDAVVSSPQWLISDTKTIAFVTSPDQSTGAPKYYPSGDLAQTTTDKFFWSDSIAGSKTVQFSATADGKSLSGTAHFTYEVPTSVNLNKWQDVFEFAGLRLTFPGNPGVSLNPTWTSPADWTPAQHSPSQEGQQFVQTLSDTCRHHHPASGSNTDYWVKLVPSSGLDTQYPYGNNPAPAPTWSDAPSEQVTSDSVAGLFPADDDELNWACSFVTYWAYKPASADADFVPLYNIHWHVAGTMSLIAGDDRSQDASWNPVIHPAGGFNDSGSACGWYQWSNLAGNVEHPVKE